MYRINCRLLQIQVFSTVTAVVEWLSYILSVLNKAAHSICGIAIWNRNELGKGVGVVHTLVQNNKSWLLTFVYNLLTKPIVFPCLKNISKLQQLQKRTSNSHTCIIHLVVYLDWQVMSDRVKGIKLLILKNQIIPSSTEIT